MAKGHGHKHFGADAVFKGTSTAIDVASTENLFGSLDEWVDEYVSPGGCPGPRSQQAEITIDGQSGRIAECPNKIEATVFVGDRFYLFTLMHHRRPASAAFSPGRRRSSTGRSRPARRVPPTR